MDYRTLSPELELLSNLSRVDATSISAAFQHVTMADTNKGSAGLDPHPDCASETGRDPGETGTCTSSVPDFPAASTYTHVLDRIDPRGG